MKEAGYSGTPLLKKLGVKDDMSALLIAVPDDITPLVNYDGWRKRKAPKTLRGFSGGPYDYIHIFSKDENSLASAIRDMKSVLADTGMIWISWPKKSSGVDSTVNGDVVRRLALRAGLVDVKVCAVDEIWSGLKLVIPVKDRKK